VERQLIGFLEKFDRWDYNGDGYLDISELQETRERTGTAPERVLEFYDVNRDGKISLAEAKGGPGRLEEAEARVAERQ
jgi:Ca2+-binding EF-hand superfamily protein